tara:strand:+ start:866 stop:1453 length:588 start_codon:yes stop_codon:yes gene_type:complete
MTSNQAISKIRVLLGVEEAPVTVEVAMSTDTLIDGTEVSVEGELEEGKLLSVVTAEGLINAPAGKHQTNSNLLVTVDEAGIITAIEEISAEATEEVDEEVEIAMEDEKVEEVMEDKEEVTVAMEDKEEMIVKIVEAMKPYFEEIKELKEKVVEMEGKFQAFSKEPAAKPIRKAETFTANKMDAIERITKIRKSNK